MADPVLWMQVQAVIDKRTTLICLLASGQIQPVDDDEDDYDPLDPRLFEEYTGGEVRDN